MSGDPNRWRRLESLFHAALERPAAARGAFLRDTTSDDPSLADAVERLIHEDEHTGIFLDEHVGAIVDDLLAGMHDALPAEPFGPYRVTGRLGAGGMGVVYRAERDDVGATVALKVLRSGVLSRERSGMFVRERRVLARLRHPRIAQLFDAGSQPDGTPWFAMEYVQGTPLAEYCRAHALPVRELTGARRDLVTTYVALSDSAGAERYRRELADSRTIVAGK